MMLYCLLPLLATVAEPVHAQAFAGADLPAGWVTSGGWWTVSEGALVQHDLATSGAYAWWTGGACRDAAITVRFRPGSAGQGVRAAGIVFRAADNLNGYYVHFDAGHQQVILVRQTAEKSWHELDRRRGIAIAFDTWHTGRVVCTGDRFTVYLNDQLVASGQDTTFPDGYAGVRAGQGTIAFDDFTLAGELVAREPFTMTHDPDSVADLPRLLDREDHLAVADEGGYFPVLVTAADGSLGAVVRGGAPHIGIGGRLDYLRSTDGGRNWSPPTVIVDSPWDDRNPAFGAMPDGSLVCAYAEAQTYNRETGKWDTSAGIYIPKVTRSHDGGQTWTEPELLAPDELHSGSPYGRIIALPDGTQMMPFYGRLQGEPKGTAGRSCCLVLRSTDGGLTWGDASVVSDLHNEFSIVALPEGRILAAMRASKGGLWLSESADAGRTWSTPTELTANQLHPADLIALDDSTVLLVHGCRLSPKGVIAWLSQDAGRSFDPASRVFVAWEAMNGDCGYPSLQLLPDGTIAMVWYAVGTPTQAGAQARCVRFTLADLRQAAGQ